MSKKESRWSLTDIFILQISAPMSPPQSQDPPKAGLPQLDFFPSLCLLPSENCRLQLHYLVFTDSLTICFPTPTGQGHAGHTHHSAHPQSLVQHLAHSGCSNVPGMEEWDESPLSYFSQVFSRGRFGVSSFKGTGFSQDGCGSVVISGGLSMTLP